MRRTILTAASLAALAFAAASPASALTMKECGAKYKEAQTAGTIGGMKWNDFRKAQCGTDATAASPAAATAPAAAATTAARARRGRAMPATTAAAPAAATAPMPATTTAAPKPAATAPMPATTTAAPKPAATAAVPAAPKPMAPMTAAPAAAAGDATYPSAIAPKYEKEFPRPRPPAHLPRPVQREQGGERQRRHEVDRERRRLLQRLQQAARRLTFRGSRELCCKRRLRAPLRLLLHNPEPAPNNLMLKHRGPSGPRLRTRRLGLRLTPTPDEAAGLNDGRGSKPEPGCGMCVLRLIEWR